jgi:hypothetical protein
MKMKRILNPNGNGFYTMMETEEFEYANPLEKISQTLIAAHMNVERGDYLLRPELFRLADGTEIPKEAVERVLFKRGYEYWQKEYEKIKAIRLPEGLLDILEIEKKKEQVKALKDVSLYSHDLLALIITACEKYGYSYSEYRSHHFPKDVDQDKLPEFAYLEEDKTVTSVGGSLTDGQIRAAIQQRNVIISKFLDKEDKWHCFLLTYKSIGGEELGHEPHMHYISNAWGLPRKMVLAQLKSKKYSLPEMPHIPFYRHINRPNSDLGNY